ncbi:MAG: type I-F CRISPR-associated protein Csy1 [Lysobacterales bacterium]
MTVHADEDPRQLRAVIDEFIQQRLTEKLDKLKETELEKRGELLAQHQRSAWLASAAHRVSQLRLASHTLKAIHPDARGSTIYLRNPVVGAAELVGTHSLMSSALDVVGNAAALDVFKLLKLHHNGETLIQRLLRNDPRAVAALSDDPIVAAEWATAFAGIAQVGAAPASHTLAKQLYFPVDDSYHLLAPLYPSALIHAWHLIVQSDRWGEEAKAARESRRKRRASKVGYVEYPDLAIQSFGGSKPQNISQLNSERGGKTHLLSCLPPNWTSAPVRAPVNCTTIFDGPFPRRRTVKEATDALRQFLYDHRAADDNNVAIRKARSELVENIVGELLAYAMELRSLTPGWSGEQGCRLSVNQRAWLDPESITDDHLIEDPDLRSEWPNRIAKAFANWLNSALQTKKSNFGDSEVLAWKHVLQPHLEALQEELEAERDERESSEVRHAA